MNNKGVVIGDGMLAEASRKYAFDEAGMVVFASGVSNSNCASVAEFNRERELLRKVIRDNSNMKVLYFSTCSIYDQSLVGKSLYVEHKKEMESLFSHHPNHLIIRLTQVVGKSRNPNLLSNYFFSTIKNRREIKVQKSAVRNIIDVDDVMRFLNRIKNTDEFRNQTVDLGSLRYDPAMRIAQVMGEVLWIEPIIVEVEGGSAYSIDTSFTNRFQCDVGVNFNDDYLRRVFSKYYGA